MSTPSTPSNATIYYEPTGANCSGTAYTRAQINAAAQESLTLASKKKTLGKDKYPHAYNDYEHFTFAHALAPYLEFPILSSGHVYAGGPPSADRVVLGSIAADFSSAVYCGVITHLGAAQRDGFAVCRDDSMNLRGAGGEIASGGREEGRGGHRGRRLLERIDME